MLHEGVVEVGHEGGQEGRVEEGKHLERTERVVGQLVKGVQ